VDVPNEDSRKSIHGSEGNILGTNKKEVSRVLTFLTNFSAKD
jgi:hypothetical protein